MPNYTFITGPAGTGKTWHAREMAVSQDGARMCATTGIAAINLGDGVTTINSLMGYYDTNSLQEKYDDGDLYDRLVRLYRIEGLRHIILDEVSMLAGEQLEIFVKILDYLDEERGIKIDLTLVGDFCQLRPVRAKFAFEVPAFDKFRSNIIKLDEVRRQTDIEFIEGLQHVRGGDQDDLAADIFKPRMRSKMDPYFDGVTIMSTNKEVDGHNEHRHMRLPGGMAGSWESVRTGDQKKEWDAIPERLQLKEDALVMVLTNLQAKRAGHYEGEEWVFDEDARYIHINGDLGHFRGMSEDGTALVTLQRNGETVGVNKVTRENVQRGQSSIDEDGQPVKGSKNVIGSVTYMPLRVAYATTVHKSQGLTLDSVQINPEHDFFGTPGMMYVALSRARTMGGLHIAGSKDVFRSRCTFDQRVKEWL